ncbi:DUF512 domain-containing protein [Anaerotruncus sp. X29]|jgi:putative radical SAM enzyme (TIGR03279 family)|nr:MULTISPECIES: DUF512 domain-containing protein [unclassified Anaerotruncus]MCI9161510.1 DUF512 domain-containing protein [Anaerotruncus sp.]NCE76394.1 DUF512 domain-containing protein [Anaerotruncus sp. X29]RKJ77125.1 DUF512 domain-containing protein [Anaerotruncus sp. 1XD22-93]EOS58236.1 hypothetical protein C814_02422 [Anaerotruncus sp. G3(2012)]MCI9236632.1 DUF512 domain-containing protein [Anaerotruncus sp.]
MPVLIQSVQPGSYAARAGIQPGDTLAAIDGHPVNDLLDYRFYVTSRRIVLDLLRAGKTRSVQIRKGEYDDIGLEFETYLMDKQRSCKNKCVFCFVDQMPPGMRETLYFKDDDSRMSFLFGNYITLTNLTDGDIDRIIQMRISPVNISVHTTDPELRVRMMKNPRAASSLAYIRRLCDADIRVNSQLVLCPGYNDGPALERTLNDLGALYPNLQSIACVPVGLTRFREGLEPLRPYDRERARETIEIIHRFAGRMWETHGERVAYPSDEFFLKAELPVPEPRYYGAFDQLEDGVGTLALLREEFEDALADDPETSASGVLSTVTGEAAYPLIRELAEQVMRKHPGMQIRVHRIENRFFGEQITVAGLVTGRDILEQLGGITLGERLLLPSVMLRHERDRFLDDLTLNELEERLGVPAVPVDNDGAQLYGAMTGCLPEGTFGERK